MKIIKRIVIFIITFFVNILCFVIAYFLLGNFTLILYRLPLGEIILECLYLVFVCALLLLYKFLFTEIYKRKINLNIDILTGLAVLLVSIPISGIGRSNGGVLAWDLTGFLMAVVGIPMALYVVVSFIKWLVRLNKITTHQNNDNEN